MDGGEGGDLDHADIVVIAGFIPQNVLILRGDRKSQIAVPSTAVRDNEPGARLLRQPLPQPPRIQPGSEGKFCCCDRFVFVGRREFGVKSEVVAQIDLR